MKKPLLLLIFISINAFATIGDTGLSISIVDNGTGINVANISNNGQELLNTVTNSGVFT